MSQHQQQTIRCLICNQMEHRRTLIGHISEHIGLNPHACDQCDFQTAFENEAMDHESLFEHSVRMNANPYISRIYRLIYNDCDYADKNGGKLDQVLHRPLANNYRNRDSRESENVSANTTAFLNNGPAVSGDELFQQKQIASMEPTSSSTHMISSTTNGYFENQNFTAPIEQVPLCQDQEPMDYGHGVEFKPLLVTESVGNLIDSAPVAVSSDKTSDDDSADVANNKTYELPDATDGLHHQAVSMMLNLNSAKGERTLPLEIEEAESEKRKMAFCLSCQVNVTDAVSSKLYHITSKHLTELEFFRCKVCDKIFRNAQSHSLAITHIRTHCRELADAGGNIVDLLENNYSTCIARCRQMLPQLFGEQSVGKRGRPKGVSARKANAKGAVANLEHQTARRTVTVNLGISRRFPQRQLK